MPEGKTIAIALLGIGLIISSVGFANSYLQSSLANQQISFLDASAPTTTRYSTITSTTISIIPLTQTTTNFDTVTNTTTRTFISTSLETVTTTSSSTYSTTYTTLQTTTQTTSLFPPSNSSYALTFMSGNATLVSTSSCSVAYYNVWLNYEVHSQLPSNLTVWAKFNDGIVVSTTGTLFQNQAYLSISAQNSHNFSACGQGVSYMNVWITDNSNNVLSPTANLNVS